MSDRLPMIILPECPHCGERRVACYLSSHREVRHSDESVFFFTCGNCWRGVCGEASSFYAGCPHELDFSDIHRIYPEPALSAAPDFTPDQVAADFIEAKSSLKNGNYKAASLMARASLETAVKGFHAEGRDLWRKINDLAERHIITPALAEWAHEIRGIGNDAAHDAGAIAEKDASDAVNFAEMLYIYLYELPGRIAERRK